MIEQTKDEEEVLVKNSFAAISSVEDASTTVTGPSSKNYSIEEMESMRDALKQTITQEFN